MRHFIFIIIFLTGCAIQRDIPPQPVISLYEHNDMHFLNVTLNGKKTMLLIDTGASKSILDISKAEEYDFDFVMLSKQQYIGLGGRQDIYAVYDYKIDEMFISFLGTDLSEITGYFKQENINIVGVLGADYLEQHNIIIDFKKNEMITP